MKSEWRKVQIKDIAYLVSEKKPLSNYSVENYISTDNMIVNKGGVCTAEKLPSTDRISSFIKGDTLFSNIRTYFKKVWWADFDGANSADVLVFRSINKPDYP